MLGQRTDLAGLQSDFYRDQFHMVLRWLIVSVVIMFLLIGGLIYAIVYQPSQQYYANTTEGKIFPMPMPMPGSA